MVQLEHNKNSEPNLSTSLFHREGVINQQGNDGRTLGQLKQFEHNEFQMN